MKYYKKLKTEKVLNLFSNNAITTTTNGRYTEHIWDLPYNFSTFSKNAEMNVISVSYENYDEADDNNIFIFRCREVLSNDVYDTYTGNGSVIYHSRGFSNENDMSNPTFKIIQPLNRLTLSITNDITDRDNGIDTGDIFIITLLIRDYDIEEVQPESMPVMENYHKYPQMKIRY